MTASLIDLARVITKTPHRPTICFDEWNIWDPVRAPGETGGEELYNLSDALALAVWLNVFIRQAKYIGMANIAQSVNVISPLMTTKTGLIKQTSYYPLYLFSKYMRGKTLGVHVSSGTYKGRTNPDWIATTMDVPWLDVSGALGDDGYVNISIVNISDENDFETDFKGAGSDVQVFTVGGKSIDKAAVNEDGKETVGIKESKWDGKGKFVFEAKSFNLLRWKA